MEIEWSTSRSRRFTPGKEPQLLFNWTLFGSQRKSGGFVEEKNSLGAAECLNCEFIGTSSGGSRFLWRVGKHEPVYTASHWRRRQTSHPVPVIIIIIFFFFNHGEDIQTALSVRLFVRKRYQLEKWMTDFHKMCYWRTWRKFVAVFRFGLNSKKNARNTTRNLKMPGTLHETLKCQEHYTKP